MFESKDYKKTIAYTNDKKEIPINNIYCIGRNYVKHIEELNSIDLGSPVVFNKVAETVVQDCDELILTKQSTNIHHEVELAIIIGKKGNNILEKDANNYIFGSAIALDLTLRDIQGEAKKNGTPWFLSKSFDNSCPMTKIYERRSIDDLHLVDIYLKVNGELRQESNTKLMMYKIPFLISYISRFCTLYPGDIILTGTPSGVGQIKDGDIIEYGSKSYESKTLKIKIN